MIVNGTELLKLEPIKDMLTEKVCFPGLPGSWGLTEIGYDIRVKQDIRFMVNEEGPIITVTDAMTREIKYFNARFCLASSIEEFQMPDGVGAIGHDKSTFARMGVQVFNTVIEPGWRGFLTIELVFNGEEMVHIPAGTGIMQLIFHELCVPAVYVGKYQDQADAPVPAKT